MKRLLAVNLSMTLILALGLSSCDQNKKLTGPTDRPPAGRATSQPLAKVTTRTDSEDQPSLRSYITVVVTDDETDPDNVGSNFAITWSDAADCSAGYNAYISNGEDKTHLGSAASDGAEITASLPNPRGEGLRFGLELYCGGRRVSSITIPHDEHHPEDARRLVPGTYSSEPALTGLTVSSGTLSPAFHSHTFKYAVPDIANANGRITVNATGKTGYTVALIRDSYFAFKACDPWRSTPCSWEYQDESGNAVYPLTDADADTPGFQVDLDEGDNNFAVHIYTYYNESPSYRLTVTRAAGAVAIQPNTPATGAPTISGTAQVGQTLTASTSGIADTDGLGHASFSYQWMANDGSTDTDIQGATGATYTLVAADAGKTVKVRVRFTDDAGNEETLTSAATSAVDHEEPVAAWSATLTVGVDASTIPATSGYSLWGDIGGTISTERFTLDGATYRVIFLMHYADGLYFGINGKLATDFTLRIGDAEYTAQESSTPNSLVEESYWWGAKDFNWTAGDQIEVSLTPVPGTGSALPDRPPAPLTAHFRFAPESHNGVDDFTFRTYFSEGISISSTTFRDHSFVVSGGSVIAAKGVNGSNRIWEITVAPNSSDDVTIALPADRACEEEGAICADDGRPLYNQPELTVPGLEEVEEEEVSEEVVPEEEEEPLEADAATTESDDHVKKPASVRKPWATNVTHNSARIEWKKASRAEEYVVLRRALYADNPESSLSPIATTSGLSYDDTDLVPQTEYIYRIVARNNVGDANRSPHVKFRTLSEP